MARGATGVLLGARYFMRRAQSVRAAIRVGPEIEERCRLRRSSRATSLAAALAGGKEREYQFGCRQAKWVVICVSHRRALPSFKFDAEVRP